MGPSTNLPSLFIATALEEITTPLIDLLTVRERDPSVEFTGLAGPTVYLGVLVASLQQ